MCIHNEQEDYDCEKCAWECGYDDFMNGEPYDPIYKDFSQCDAYKDGWEEAKKQISQKMADDDYFRDLGLTF